ncbi:YppE family protein [Salibacterium aidingense]|uniref:YppE family protein n=1 Tax=Salibacterium aidingense TaxID=384933 RepID=UPI000421A74B|nr:YppE family protein [Salibacterium aidingense]
MLQEQKKELYDKTNALKQLNNQALQNYTTIAREPEYSPDFYEEVKPFADQVKAWADEWKPLAEKWVIEEKPPYFYLKQIEDTHDNLLISSVTSFQSDTKQKRFREMIQSIDYILSGMENELNLQK